MLVEFHEDDVLGTSMYISQSEFAKADKSDEEFQSLWIAINAYMALMGLENLDLPKEIYEEISRRLRRGNSLVFTTVRINPILEQYRFQVLVSDNGRLKVIVDWDGSGYTLVDE